MSTIAIIAILVALLLGGLIAALGDRIGTKVGKARLRLFNLRPKQTATLVTVVTGTLISASTLGVLLASSEPLRQGLFQLDEIKRDLRVAKDQLKDTKREKQNIEEELEAARREKASVQNQLKTLNHNFQTARNQLKSVSAQAKQLRSDIQTLLKDRENLSLQRQQLSEQMTHLQVEIQARDSQLQEQKRKISEQNQILQQRQQKLLQLEQQLQSLQTQQNRLKTEIEQRDQQISSLDQAIAQKDQILQKREAKLTELSAQLTFLQQQVAVLEEYYQTYQELRERQIAIVRGQVLAFGAVRIVDPKAIIPAIDELLRQANRNAIRAVDGNNGDIDPSERVVKITKAQVEQLIQQLQEQQDYVVRILSAGNYVQGEREVRVFADVVPNQQVFQKKEIISQVSIDTNRRNEAEIQKRLDLLLSAAQFRARRSGIVGPIQVEEGQIKTLISFIEKVSQSSASIDEIQAIALGDTYTVGPLKLRLLAMDRGEVIFSSEV